MRSSFVAPVLGLLALLAPVRAQAMSCDEIMNMVSLNIPTNIVIETMKGSGQTENRMEPHKSPAAADFMGRGGAVGGGYDPPDHHEIITPNRTQVHGMVEKRRRKLMEVPV